jgi:hypothetical protein
MKISELIQKTPEMTEEKLLKIMNSHLDWIKKDLKNRIVGLHRSNDKPFDLAQAFLDEHDLIQDKKSYLTKSQREQVVGFVGFCMIQMTKDGTGNSESTSND